MFEVFEETTTPTIPKLSNSEDISRNLFDVSVLTKILQHSYRVPVSHTIIVNLVVSHTIIVSTTSSTTSVRTIARSKRPKNKPVARAERSRRTNREIDNICAIMADEVDNNPDLIGVNVASYAREHDVPYQRLNARWNGRSTLSDRPFSHLRLSETQEQALTLYCVDRNRIGIAVPLKMLNSVVEAIVAREMPNGEVPCEFGNR